MYMYIYVCVCVCVCMYVYVHIKAPTNTQKHIRDATDSVPGKHIRDATTVYPVRCPCVKLIAFELAAKFSRRGENPLQPSLCNTKNAIFITAQNGVFPSVAIFAGQLKCNQLHYICVYSLGHLYLDSVTTWTVSLPGTRIFGRAG
jgi:hypothetical protein